MPDTTAPSPVRLERHQLRRRVLSVRNVVELSPRMRRITLGGDDLEADFPCIQMATDAHVKLFFPDPETGELIVPDIADNAMSIDPNRPRPIFRDYTVRGFDAQTKELSIDFVLHTHGIAGAWAANATEGDQLGVLGPRGSHIYPDDFPWYIIAGDETAIPAIGRWIEELPASAKGVAIIEIGDASEEQELAGDAGIEVRYITRPVDGTSRLGSVVQALSLPDEEYFVFAAGEAGILKPIRRYFRRDLGLDKERVIIDGYWKQGTINLDHHAEDTDDD